MFFFLLKQKKTKIENIKQVKRVITLCLFVMFIHWKYFRLLKTSSAHFGNLKRNCFRELEERNSIRTYVTEWQFLCRVSLTRNSRNDIFTPKSNLHCNIQQAFTEAQPDEKGSLMHSEWSILVRANMISITLHTNSNTL